MELNHDRCWICLLEDREDWRKVCNCNLWAHEACILEWARTRPETEPPRCPQCRQEIAIESGRSTLLDLTKVCSTIGGGVLGGLAFSYGIRVVLSDVLYQSMYEYGALTVKLMCSAGLSKSLLGPLWSVHHRLAPVSPGIFYNPPMLMSVSPAQFKRFMALPLIPVWLASNNVSQATAATVLGAILATLPDAPQRSVALALLFGRPIYNFAWNMFSLPILRRLADRVLEQTRKDEYTAAVEQLEHLIDQAMQQRQEPEEPVELPPPQEDQAGQFMQALGNVVAIQNQRDGEFLLEKPSTPIQKLHALATPFYSSLVGKLLGLVPILRQWDPLYRNVLGMCLLVVGKDVLDLLVAVRVARVETTKHVLNYDEPRAEHRSRLLNWLLRLTHSLDNMVGFDMNVNVGIA